MWCVGRLTAEYRERMYDLLALSSSGYDAREPVVCLDEKSKQLLAQTRAVLPGRAGCYTKEDYEYRRAGTRNLFVAVEPRAGHREVSVTLRRTKRDFVEFVQRLVDTVYAGATLIHLVLDNLNTHARASFVAILGETGAAALLSRVRFHYTPKHASWLNMAEIEIGVLNRQCLQRRLPDDLKIRSEVAAWTKQRNEEKRCLEWKFTRQEADKKLGKHYVT